MNIPNKVRPKRFFLVSIVSVIAMVALVACAGSRVTETTRTEYRGVGIRSVAIAPGGGPITDAIGVELFNLGINVVDAEQTMSILGRVGLTEFQITTKESFQALRNAGADAVLVVKSVMANDGTPESAVARLTLTSTSELVAGITWQNGWGGQRGSIADRIMRQNLAEAATQIAKELVKRMR